MSITGLFAAQYYAHPDTTFLTDNARWANIVALPLDGLFLTVEMNNLVNFGEVIWGPELLWADLSDILTRLQTRNTLGWGRIRQNFITINTEGSQGDWYDDVLTATTIANFKLAGRLVVEAGLEGIWFDAEGYNWRQWQYDQQALNATYTFEQYQKKAYDAGFEIATYYKSIDPNFQIILTHSYIHLVDFYDRFGGETPANQLLAEYGLYNPFLDGLYDAFGRGRSATAAKNMIVTTEETFLLKDEASIDTQINKAKGIPDVRNKGGGKYFSQVESGDVRCQPSEDYETRELWLRTKSRPNYFDAITDTSGTLWLDYNADGVPLFTPAAPNTNYFNLTELENSVNYILDAGPMCWFLLSKYYFYEHADLMTNNYLTVLQTIRTERGLP